MREIKIYFGIMFLLVVIIFLPSFVFASDVCYVIQNTQKIHIVKDDVPEGDKKNPYNSISQAIERKCGTINVENGVYAESFVLDKNMKLEGTNKDLVIIKGTVAMDDGSNMRGVTVDHVGGIKVLEGASVYIDAIKVINGQIGIETTKGGGELVVTDSLITLNKKGIYLQKEKQVIISGCKIYDNYEEGVDIRAGVSGDITNNEIYDNGESGIEIILGNSTLNIANNTIQYNHAHGIAPQYYTDFQEFGDINIENNTIRTNEKYGINCKSPSGGRDKPKGYWEQSMTLLYNIIADNAEKDFASACKFDEEMIAQATKTEQEKESERAILNEKKKNESLTIDEDARLAKLESEYQRLEEKKQIQKKLRSDVDELHIALQDLSQKANLTMTQVNQRKKYVTFFIGPNYKALNVIADDVLIYDEKIDLMRSKKIFIMDKETFDEVGMQVEEMERERDQLLKFLEDQSEKKGLFSWYFKKKYER